MSARTTTRAARCFGAALAFLGGITMTSGLALADPAALLFRGDARSLLGEGPDLLLPDRTVSAAEIHARFASETIDPDGVIVWRLDADEIGSVGTGGAGLPLPFASSIVFDRASHQRSLRAFLAAAEARELAADEGAIVAFAVRLVPEPGFATTLFAGISVIAARARVRRRRSDPPLSSPGSERARRIRSVAHIRCRPADSPATAPKHALGCSPRR